jgi:uncharacterized membrane protein YtjA (UPF0391 family)
MFPNVPTYRAGVGRTDDDSCFSPFPAALVEYDKITQSSDGGNMIYWALMFLLVAIIAAVFGFTGIALAAAGIAKLLFFIFLILFVITFASHLTRSTGTRI